ncbi:MAG: glutamine--tRNA ligase/YqeY domain fusion protein [Anaerolineae bacterium]|jgi:glutaminyl-tRNA synthetase
MSMASSERPSDFIRDIIRADLERGETDRRVHTRFPPEPNGYLHIGHAKAICVNFGIATEFGGLCNLRMDDTDPTKESWEYVEAQKRDIRWLGFDWEDRLFFASDYFEQLYEWAVALIKEGKAYVDDLGPEEIREYRGDFTTPGRESPYRNRSVEENLDLFERMRAGEFEAGERVLRAKIDMSASNMNLRDPVMYRILYETHYKQGDDWCIYPTYDWTHGQSDSIEGITHSLCSLEFEDHRPLYDWYLDQLVKHHQTDRRPRQIEFARLFLSHTVVSKRKLLELVDGGYVNGWDDPRMPTISGIRRRGYPPEAIRRFCDEIGLAKGDSLIDMDLLEHCVRQELNRSASRVFAVVDPLKVVIDNYPEGKVDAFEIDVNPEDPESGTRRVPFSRVLYIERDDFREVPPKKFFRLAPGREVRLKGAYLVTCERVVKDEHGNVSELRCTYDPTTKGGEAPDGRRVRGTLHWVSAEHAVDVELRLYDRLFTKEDMGDIPEDGPDGPGDYRDYLNPESLTVVMAKVEPSVEGARPGDRYQFFRKAYVCVDPDSTPDHLVFNQTVPLRSTWDRIVARMQRGAAG